MLHVSTTQSPTYFSNLRMLRWSLEGLQLKKREAKIELWPAISALISGEILVKLFTRSFNPFFRYKYLRKGEDT